MSELTSKSSSSHPALRVVAIFICTVAAAAVHAQSFTFDSAIRTRYESKQDFDFSGGDQSYFLTQLRLDFGYRLNEQSNVFVQLQDARVFGESRTEVPPINDAAVPNVFADQLDFHQAYFEHDFGTVSLRAGRQKFNLADNRLVASLEWVNTARVHDGVRITIDNGESREIDVFFSRPVAVDPNDFNDQAKVGNRYFDSDFHGIMVSDGRGTDRQIEYWYFYRGNSDLGDRVNTVGARAVRRSAPWGFELQGAWQFGDFGGLDHSGTMLHASVRRELAVGSWIASYSYGSGDDDPGDGDHGTFDNLYPLNHPYYGHMDLFSLQNVHDIEVAYTRPLSDRVGLRAAVNGFWLDDADSDAWYNAGLAPLRRAGSPADSYVGSELDLMATFTLIPNQLSIVAGLSRFFGGGYLDDTGAGGDADFFYLELSYRP
ncbi:MAG: alginate export family protein [Gammaproteobacteria bacterium]